MKKFLLFTVLTLFCMVQTKADDSDLYEFWTKEGCESECASKLEVTPDKPYAELWMKYFSKGTKNLKLYIKYTLESQPSLIDTVCFTDIDRAYVYKYSSTRYLKCGVVTRLFEYNDNPYAEWDNKNMKFKFYVSHVPKEGKLQIYIQKTKPEETEYIFDIVDGSNITVLDPILDTQADLNDKDQHIGQQKCFISSLAEITDYRWTDYGNPNFIKNTSDSKNMLSVTLPQTDRAQKRTIALRTNYIPNGTFEQSIVESWDFTTTAEVNVKPYHSIVQHPFFPDSKYISHSDYYSGHTINNSAIPIFTSWEDYNNGIRKYVSLVSRSGRRLIFNPEKGKIESEDKSVPFTTASLFTFVGTSESFQIYPYRLDECLGYNMSSGDISLGGSYNTWKFKSKDGTIAPEDYTEMCITVLTSSTVYLSYFALPYDEEVINGGADHVWYDIDYYGIPTEIGCDINSYQDPNPDRDGFRHPKNIIRWTILNPKDEDAVDNDQFIIQRAYKPDFSDAQTIATYEFEDTLKTENDFGIYEYVDDDEEALYNKYERGQSFKNRQLPKMYYRVMRSTAYGLWPNDMGKFQQEIPIELTSVSPELHDFMAEKSADWESEKKAVLVVSFYNYLQGDCREFVWDPNVDINITRKGYEDLEKMHPDSTTFKTITIKGSEVNWDNENQRYFVTIEDVLEYPYTYYFYETVIDTTNAVYPVYYISDDPIVSLKSIADGLYFKDVAFISSLTASQGDEKGRVKLQWETAEGLQNGFKIERQTILSYSMGEKVVLADDITDCSYIDNTVEPGRAYQYRVYSKAKFRGKEYESYKDILGWCSVYGSISGRVQLKNGARMPGKILVTAKRNEEINIIGLRYDDRTLIPSFSEQSGNEKSVYCDENGYFIIDSLAYQGGNTRFTVSAKDENGSLAFKSNSGSDNFTATLNSARPEYEDVVFTNTEEHRISGRVLYENSTVPVKDVCFRIFYNGDPNGYVLKDVDGENIVTNQTGNFEFYVPKADIRIQAFKEGHTMKGDGFIKDKNDSVQFVPTTSLDGLELADLTKVRLIGRICGGDREGDKTLGFGRSINNLGDNLTVVMQLEGDNTAQIVYHRDDPDNTTDNYSDALGNDTTLYTFEKKRIVIKPNIKTGEFAVNLFPVRYKVTQMSAEGYSSLYNEGEGFQVLDLSSDSIAHGSFNILDKDTVRYNATFTKVYHEPVTVTYKQCSFGTELAYIGEQKINTKNFENEKVTIQLADKKTGEYTFGCPIFKQGTEYTLKAFAHEDYYYNGKKSNLPDVVNIKSGKLIVSNGLVSATSEQTLKLDTAGTAQFRFTPDNPEFILTGEDALRSLRLQVDLNGRFYDAEPLRAYVIGSRSKGKDVQLVLPKDINVLDIVRDPMGSGSYAYREKGTTYTWSHDYSVLKDNSIDIDVTTGYGTTYNVGVGFQVQSSFEIVGHGGVSIPLNTKNLTKKSAEYTMTLNERIATSDDMFDEGAQSDVYIGTTSGYVVTTREANTIVDEITYGYLKSAIGKGAVRLVHNGTDNDGKQFYIVTGDQVAIGEAITSTFAYSQKHVLGVLIPELEKERNALLRTGMDAETAQKIADESGECVYISSNDENDPYFDPVSDDNLRYKCIFPSGQNDFALNEVDSCNTCILGWREMIKREEERKLKAFQGEPVSTYSIAGTEVSHSEDASSYYYEMDEIHMQKSETGWHVGLGGGKDGLNQSGEFAEEKGQESGGQENNTTQNEDQANKGKEKNSTAFKVHGIIFSLGVNCSPKIDVSEDVSYYKMQTAGTGYTLKSNDNGYFTTEVYEVDNDNGVTGNSFVDGFTSEDTKNHTVHSHIFRTIGGAVRAPWFPADSTMVYVDPVTKKRQPLGGELKKIDNPKIYIDEPVVSNVPQSERAVFAVRLVNETEISDASMYLNPTSLKLKLVDESNPNGAKLYMDGMPITDGRHFMLDPGKSIMKTIEVERGTGYDFENLKLQFEDETLTLTDQAAISVHFLPEATPVNIKTPDNQWVMNTLSAKDEEGKFYLPVNISGFDKNSEDFHHIEFQYKKHTEGESQWVNLCSYFAKEDSLYKAARGEKALIEGGSISNIRFYGEKDPVEMEYDLRAVSFRKWGTGYVTKASNVVSGMKDTRPPMVFGMPKPVNGILTYEDVISLPFSENIAYNYLDETANFQIQGYTNNSDIDASTSLKMSQSGSGLTKVARNLARHDFTIDMMVKTDDPDGNCRLITADTIGINTMAFGITDGHLWVWMSGRQYSAKAMEKTDFSKALTRVGLIYTANDSTVNFLCNQNIIGKDKIEVKNYYEEEFNTYPDSLKGACNANGILRLGGGVDMNLKDVRLWNKALTKSEISNTYKKKLTGTEPGLLAYWPLDETQGNIAVDKSNGADFYLENCSWSVQAGKSLRLESEAVKLDGGDFVKFQRDKSQDYTLSFWFKADELKADTTTLFRTGIPESADKDSRNWIITFKNGKLIGRNNRKDYEMGDINYNEDHSWHRLDISVNHSVNRTAFMIDGSLVNQTSADSIGGFTDNNVQLGCKEFVGNIDNFTFWHVALPINYIKSMYNTTPSGKEMELQIFMPFSKNDRNDQNTIIQVFSPYNMVINNAEGEAKTEKKPMFEVNDKLIDNKNQAPVHSDTGLSNLPFNWTSTDTELQINIKNPDIEINHQQINITVRGVEDLRGNSLESPQMWTVYVDRNVLKWDEQTINLDLKYGEGKTFKTTWQNKCGRNVEYTIINNCHWLSIDKDRGAVQPIHKEELEITISDGLAPGEYSTVLYLIDENQLSSPLEVNVTVTADEPEWAVTTNSAFNQMMNLVGQVKVNENSQIGYSTDRRDIVAAFYQNTCIGKANITLKNNSSYIYMNILGCSSMDEKNIDFYLWNASNNQISMLAVTANGNNGNGVAFKNGEVVGSIEKPVQFAPSDSRIQSISLNEGWNWVSLNVKPDSTSVQNLFISNDIFTADDKFTTMNGGFITYVNGQRGQSHWSANDGDIQIDKNKVYQIYVQHPGTVNVRGKIFADSERYITLDRKGWNNLPYLLDEDLPVNGAMSDYLPMDGGKARPGTVIKSHSSFAMAGNDGRWYGTLEYMHPGEGYYVNHTGDVPCKIWYTNTNVDRRQTRAANVTDNSGNNDVMNLRRAESSEMNSSMPVIAVPDGILNFNEDDEVIAVVNGEIVGHTNLREAQECKKYFFITVNSEDGGAIRFALVRNGQIKGVTSKSLTYSSSGIAGSLENPYILTFDSDASALGAEFADGAYDLLGRKMNEEAVRLSNKNVFIINGKKVLKR